MAFKDITMTPHPWTPSGLELLLRFELMIRQSGGNERLAMAIEAEHVKQSRYDKCEHAAHTNGDSWSSDEVAYLRKHFLTDTAKYIAAFLNRSTPSVRSKIIRMQDHNELPFKRLPWSYRIQRKIA